MEIAASTRLAPGGGSLAFFKGSRSVTMEAVEGRTSAAKA